LLATPRCTGHVAFHAAADQVAADSTAAQVAAALAACGARDIRPGDLPSLPPGLVESQRIADQGLVIWLFGQDERLGDSTIR
jgi:hypothetical protein